MTQRICVIRNDALGDAVLSCPLIANIKALWPDATLTVIAQPSIGPLLRYHSAIDTVLDAPNVRGLSGFIAAYRLFKHHAFSHIFFAHLDPSYVWAAWLARCPHRVGMGHTLILTSLLTQKTTLKHPLFLSHEAQIQCQLLRSFTSKIDYTLKHFDLPQSRDSLAEAYTLPINRPWCVIHPGFGDKNRGWPPEQYAALIPLLNQSHQVILTGTPTESNLTTAIAQQANPLAINVCGKTNLIDLAALIHHADLVIGPDTGPVHLAALFGRKVVCISPIKYIRGFRWGPFNTHHRLIKDTGHCPYRCVPYRAPCQQPHCIEPLTHQRVASAVASLLETPSTTPIPTPNDTIHNWLRIEGVVCVDIESNDQWAAGMALYTWAHPHMRHCWITTRQAAVARQAAAHGVPCLYRPTYRMDQWIQRMSQLHTLVWHAKPSIWHQAIVHGTALNTDHKPVLAPLGLPKTLSEWTHNLTNQ
ncbi:MAG: glycosyltransferase family 9 protein [Candidatus Marinamargulisbacteria bacterium]|nr:glycosyltransferase family 9 protein [Candidatus Marinamargulisbacteria bacterium]